MRARKSNLSVATLLACSTILLAGCHPSGGGGTEGKSGGASEATPAIDPNENGGARIEYKPAERAPLLQQAETEDSKRHLAIESTAVQEPPDPKAQTAPRSP